MPREWCSTVKFIHSNGAILEVQDADNHTKDTWETIKALEQELAQRTRERDGEREAREKIERAYRKLDAAMGILFERLNKAGVDCSDLIP